MKDHQAFHAELLDKETHMIGLRGKAKELMRNREHVPGMRETKEQLKVFLI